MSRMSDLSGKHTPVHVFLIEREDGTTSRLLIPGGLCDHRYPQRLKPGERVVLGARTWRSSPAFIDMPACSQPDYQT